jgi:2-methylcitrate dehydratase
LYNPADRDHCLQYIVAIGLIYGELNAEHYEDNIAKNPAIDSLRDKMEVIEDKQFSQDYLDPNKRSIANAIQIYFNDGTSTEKVQVEYPIGHRRRREEGTPVLLEKFKTNLLTRFPRGQAEQIINLSNKQEDLENMAVNQFMDAFII